MNKSNNSQITVKKEKPIIFSTDMVKAIMAGNKTQTRRVAKNITDCKIINNRNMYTIIWKGHEIKGDNPLLFCPYEIGQTLWVKETFNDNWCDKVIYKADGGSAKEAGYKNEPKWKPSIFMPRKAARLFLKVTNLRIEQVQDISEEDIIAEGIKLCGCSNKCGLRDDFKTLWDSINKKRGYGWKTNPYCWVYDFEVIK